MYVCVCVYVVAEGEVGGGGYMGGGGRLRDFKRLFLALTNVSPVEEIAALWAELRRVPDC